MSKVFLSYPHRDSALAARVAEQLAKAGMAVFDPAHDISSEQSWRKKVIAAIEATDIVALVIGSPDAAASSWITYETGVAEARGKQVIVLASHDFALSELPIELEGYRVVSFDPERPRDWVVGSFEYGRA